MHAEKDIIQAGLLPLKMPTLRLTHTHTPEVLLIFQGVECSLTKGYVSLDET